MVTIISLGGSIVAPDKPDTQFVSNFVSLIKNYLDNFAQSKIILIVGGGGPARTYQTAFKAIEPAGDDQAADWIGIMATRLNAQLIKACFGRLCTTDVVTDPTGPFAFGGRVLVAAGWKPGFSTDFDAVMLAERFGSKQVLNLSNIAKVYTDDPKKNPQAKPLDHISWADFRLMVGDDWTPGKNTPFDPIASKKAEALELKVICASGTDLANLSNILNSRSFVGTTIG